MFSSVKGGDGESDVLKRARLGPWPHLWHPLDHINGSNIVGPPSKDAKPKATRLEDFDEVPVKRRTAHR